MHERADLRHRMELPRVLRIHGKTMGKLRTGIVWLGTLAGVWQLSRSHPLRNRGLRSGPRNVRQAQ